MRARHTIIEQEVQRCYDMESEMQRLLGVVLLKFALIRQINAFLTTSIVLWREQMKLHHVRQHLQRAGLIGKMFAFSSHSLYQMAGRAVALWNLQGRLNAQLQQLTHWFSATSRAERMVRLISAVSCEVYKRVIDWLAAGASGHAGSRVDGAHMPDVVEVFTSSRSALGHVESLGPRTPASAWVLYPCEGALPAWHTPPSGCWLEEIGYRYLGDHSEDVSTVECGLSLSTA